MGACLWTNVIFAIFFSEKYIIDYLWVLFSKRDLVIILSKSIVLFFFSISSLLYRFVENFSFGRKINRAMNYSRLFVDRSGEYLHGGSLMEKASWWSIGVSRWNRNRRPNKPIRNNQSNGSGPNVNLDCLEPTRMVFQACFVWSPSFIVTSTDRWSCVSHFLQKKICLPIINKIKFYSLV